MGSPPPPCSSPRALRAPAEVPIPYATLLVWASLLALLPVLHADDLIGRDAALAAWLFLHALLAALAVYALARAMALIRARPPRAVEAPAPTGLR